MWDLVGLNLMYSSDNVIDKLTVWLWGLGMPKDVHLGAEIWEDGKVTYTVRMIHPTKGVSGTVCILCPTLKRLKGKGFGHQKAQLKAALSRDWTKDETWQEWVTNSRKEWVEEHE
jgi:hypothetical protein